MRQKSCVTFLYVGGRWQVLYYINNRYLGYADKVNQRLGKTASQVVIREMTYQIDYLKLPRPPAIDQNSGHAALANRWVKLLQLITSEKGIRGSKFWDRCDVPLANIP